MTELQKINDRYILPKRCDRCGQHMTIKIKAEPKAPILTWYYWCEACLLTEVFMQEPLNDDESY